MMKQSPAVLSFKVKTVIVFAFFALATAGFFSMFSSANADTSCFDGLKVKTVANGQLVTLCWKPAPGITLPPKVLAPNSPCVAVSTPTSGGWSGAKGISGSESTASLLNPPASYSFTLTCSDPDNPFGTLFSDFVTVNVAPSKPDLIPLVLADTGTSHPVILSSVKNPNGSYLVGSDITFTVNPKNISTGFSLPVFNVKLQKAVHGSGVFADTGNYASVSGGLQKDESKSGSTKYTWVAGDTGYDFRYCVDMPPDNPGNVDEVQISDAVDRANNVGEYSNCSDSVWSGPPPVEPPPAVVNLQVRTSGTGLYLPAIPPSPAPAYTYSVNYGDKIDLQWSTTNASVCKTNSWTIQTGTSGNQTIATPLSNVSYSYTITCTGLNGVDVISNKITVNVAAPTLTCTGSLTGLTGNWAATPTPLSTLAGITFSYLWSGDDIPAGTTGTNSASNNANSYSINYTTAGTKNATVNLTATGNRTASANCVTNPTGGLVVKPDLTPLGATGTGVTTPNAPVLKSGGTTNLSDGKYRTGTNVTFTVEPINIGAGFDSPTFTISLQKKLHETVSYTAGVYVGSASVEGGLVKDVKNSKDRDIVYTLLAGDTNATGYDFHYCIDMPPDDGTKVAESNEGNNCSGDVNIKASPGTCTDLGNCPATTVDLWATYASTDYRKGVKDGGFTTSYAPTVLLKWTSTNATACTGTGFSTGAGSPTSNTTNGVPVGPLSAASNLYSITCTGLGDSGTDTITVTVNAPTVSCSGSLSGLTGTWTATPAPTPVSGTLYYSYLWSGTDIPTSPAPFGTPSPSQGTNTYTINYTTSGLKSASVAMGATGRATTTPVACTPASLNPLPDLIPLDPPNAPMITGGTKNPDGSFVISQSIPFKIQPKNQGAGTTASFKSKLQWRVVGGTFADGENGNLNGLAKDASADITTLSYTPTALGTYEFRYCVDLPPNTERPLDSGLYPGAIDESNENNNCSGNATTTVIVANRPAATVDLYATYNAVDYLKSVKNGTFNTPYAPTVLLKWTSTNATACTGTGFSTGAGSPTSNTTNGVPVGPLSAASNLYSITCTGLGDSGSDSVTITVSGLLTVTKSGTGTGVVSSSPAGIDCNADCSEPYTQGTSVTLTANPSKGSSFDPAGGWTGCGSVNGSGQCVVSVIGSKTVNAKFDRLVASADLKCGGSDAPTLSYNDNCNLTWVSSNTTGTCSITSSRSLSGYPKNGVPTSYTGTTGTYNSGDLNRDVTFTLNCSAVSGSSGTPVDSVTVKILPEVPSVTPTAGACGGNINLSYSGGDNTTSLNLYRRIDADTSPYDFVETKSTLGSLRTTDSGLSSNHSYFYQVSATNANGTVYSSRPKSAVSSAACFNYSLSCSDLSTTSDKPVSETVTKTLLAGNTQAVTLSLGAMPDGLTGSFTNNPSNPTSTSTLKLTPTRGTTLPNTYAITVNGAPTPQSGAVKCVFNLTVTDPSYTLTVTKAGSGTGTVVSNEGTPKISCGATCSASYVYKSTPALTASASTGSTFTGWAGACTGTGTCSLTMDGDKAVTANFTSNPTVTLSAKVSGSGDSFSTGSLTVKNGDKIDLKWETANSPTSCTATANPADSQWTGAKTATGGTLDNVGPQSSSHSPQTYTITCSKTGTPDTVPSEVVITVTTQPTVTLTADPISVPYNTGSTLTWTSTENPDTCTGTNFSTGGKTSGSVSTGNLTTPQTYTITCTKKKANDATATASVGVQLAQPGLTAAVTACTLPSDNGKVTLTVTTVPGATSYNLYRNTSDTSPYPTLVGNYVNSNPSFVVTDSGLTAGTTYYYQVAATSTTSGVFTGYSVRPKSAAASRCVLPTVTLTANPTSITRDIGDSSTLTWTSTDAVSCASPGASGGSAIPGFPTSGATNLNSSTAVTPTTSTTYGITCTNPSGSVSATALVTVVVRTLAVSCSATPTTVDVAASTPVTWTASGTLQPSPGNYLGGVPPYTYKWTGDSPLDSVPPTVTGNRSVSNNVTYTDAGTKYGHMTVTDSVGTAVTVDCSPNFITATNSHCDLGLVIYPTVVKMAFIGKTATSQKTKANVVSVASCSQDMTLTPTSATIVDSKGVSTPVTINYYDVSTGNPSNRIIYSSQYLVGINLAVSAQKQIADGLYTLTITGTGSMVDQSTGTTPVVTQTFQVNVQNVKPGFQEF